MSLTTPADDAAMASAGWTRLPTQKFTLAIGTAWSRGEVGARTLAIRATEQIVNDYGEVVHGGALMTFADMALGSGAADALGPGIGLVTVQLQYHFAGGVRVPQLITCAPELVRRTSSLVFVRGMILADGDVVGSADGIFKALKPRV